MGRVAIHRSDRCREQPDLRHRRRQAYNWDSRKRLTLITGVASFLYDGLNRRESITQGGTTKAYLYDGLNPVQEQQGGSVFANLLTGLGIDERFTRTTGGVTSTFLTDLLGSTMALTNSSGVIQTSYAYGPYGGVTVTGASNSNTYQYAGRENDGTGLDYYRARYYKPSYGRFISEDQIGLNGGSNLYAYANGDPVNYNDPTGLLGSLNPKTKDYICELIAQCAGNLQCVWQKADRQRLNDGWNNPVYRDAENWAYAAGFPGPETTPVPIWLHQVWKKVWPYNTTPYSQDALNAGLEGENHQNESPADLKKWCDGCTKK